MASGLIYLIIIGMWAAYFLPHWISSHEDSSGRSGEKYKNAIRTVGSSATHLVPEFEEPLKRRRTIARRRAVFTSLGIFFVATLFLSLLGFLTPLIVAVPVTGTFLYAANVRRQVASYELRQRRLQALQKVTESPVMVTEYSVQLEIQRDSFNNEHWIPGQWSAEQEILRDIAPTREELFDQELAENAAIPHQYPDEWAVNE